MSELDFATTYEINKMMFASASLISVFKKHMTKRKLGESVDIDNHHQLEIVSSNSTAPTSPTNLTLNLADHQIVDDKLSIKRKRNAGNNSI
jgi:hypothetical protein